MLPTLNALSGGAINALGQLFVNGPTWDGNLVTKSGRTELVQLGLADKVEGGWNYLTREGVQVASEWRSGGCGDRNLEQRWIDKVSCK